ncbi:hypothetical protein [Pediococcus acidilactici]|uniref:Uncharacterized protein n=1 Tax=Pediococcus acidilactici DSM 20284 TaxID=862514 RepID=E0NDC9_PEDAC|nr:hypothetical protein [Pediococcus acidilactici]AZP90629.1 hypothetical protein CYD95_04435 [Pediococcus acidilactici]EFL96250.1 hypothetical protein HMPREF0623_0301 [Pediococcus acidilactici DSM 20284]MDG9739601.1 hypothetical protein [Pediococcus acidilactici]NKZ16083.1 hypothetical protein [Pediococcus acidilactici]QQT96070.1 hypothetical protein I6I90_01045 [Pediococcus acidilactici]
MNKLKIINLVTDDLTDALDDTNRKQLVDNFKSTEDTINKIIDILNTDDDTDCISKQDVITLFTELVKVLQYYDMPISFDGKHIKNDGEE